MTAVTQTRESGVEILDVAPQVTEEAEAVLFRTPEPVEIQVAVNVSGNPVVTENQHFAAVDVDYEDEVHPMEAQMNGMSEDDDDITVQDDGTWILDVDEASVFLTDDEGEIGTGIVQVDGGDIEAAISEFEEEYL